MVCENILEFISPLEPHVLMIITHNHVALSVLYAASKGTGDPERPRRDWFDSNTWQLFIWSKDHLPSKIHI